MPSRANPSASLSKKNGASNSLLCKSSCVQWLSSEEQMHGQQKWTTYFLFIFQEYLDKAKRYPETEAYLKAIRKRNVWTETLFGEAKEFHGLRRFRLRRLRKVNIEGVMVAAGQNLKRLIQHHLARLFSFLISLFSAFDFLTDLDFFNRLVHCATVTRFFPLDFDSFNASSASSSNSLALLPCFG